MGLRCGAVVTFLLFLSMDATFATVHATNLKLVPEAQIIPTTASGLLTTITQALQTARPAQQTDSDSPPTRGNGFSFSSSISMALGVFVLQLFILSVLFAIINAAGWTHSVVRSLRTFMNLFEYSGPKPFGARNVFSSLIIVFLAILYAVGIAFWMAAQAKPKIVRSWQWINDTTRFSVIAQYCVIIGIIVCTVLSFLPYWYRYLLRMDRPLKFGKYINNQDTEVFDKVAGFTSGKAILHLRPSEPETCKPNSRCADPALMLLYLFHPEVMIERWPKLPCFVDRMKSLLHGKAFVPSSSEDEPICLSKLNIPNFKKMESVTEIREKVDEYRKLQDTENSRRVSAEEELVPQFEMLYHIMKEQAEVVTTIKNDPFKETVDDAGRWAGFLFVLSILLMQISSFVGETSSCPLLVDQGRVVQYLDWYIAPTSPITEPLVLPHFAHVSTWQCGNAFCSLQCEKGYTPRRGVVECIDIGGSGRYWSHSEALPENLPACCIGSGDLPALNDFQINATLLQLKLDKPEPFSFGCGGSQQKLTLDVCSESQSALCDDACFNGAATCKRNNLRFLPTTWSKPPIANRNDTDSLEQSVQTIPLSASFAISQGNWYRLFYDTPQDSVSGRWKLWTNPSRALNTA